MKTRYAVATCFALVTWLVLPTLADDLITGVPDWNQPGNYSVAGYPAWCAPTSGANIMGYWEDRLGLTGLADRQISPNTPAYPNNGNTWMQGLWHDGTIEMGWYMDTGSWRANNGPFPPNNGGTLIGTNIGPGAVAYAQATWTDPGGLNKVAFANASTTKDTTANQAMWNKYMGEINSGKPVLCTFSTWADTQQGTTTVNGQTVHLYSVGNGGYHTVAGVGYIDPTPAQFNGDERIIAQDNWPTTPQYVAVQTTSWHQNDYVNISNHSGPVAYYPLNGDYQDATGSYHASGAYGTGFTTDRDGNPNSACLFDAFGERIKVPHEVLDGKGDFTLFAWIKVTDVSVVATILSGANASEDNEALFGYHPGNNLGLIAGTNNISPIGVSNIMVPANEWVSIAWVRHSDSGTSEIYLNGVNPESVNTGAGAIDIDLDGLWLGLDQDAVGGGWEEEDQFYGMMDDVYFYGRALSADEVYALHIPEPATLSLLALGGLAILHRRRK